MTESSATRQRRPRLTLGSKAPALVGTVCALIGLLDLATGIIPRLRHSRVHTWAGYLPGAVSSIAAAASIIVGLLPPRPPPGRWSGPAPDAYARRS